jgi:gas vesicle protein
MKFVVGFLSGVVVGAVGAVAYSIQTGRDLREAFDEVRSDLSRRDLDVLGARLESRVSEMQVQLEARIAQVREKAATAAEDARAGVAAAAAESTEAPPAADKPEG